MQGYILIFGLLVTSDYLVKQTGLNIPGSILGLVILFLIFCIKGSVNENVDSAAKVLLKFLPLFLVPIGVGIKELITHVDITLLTMIGVSILALICAVFITVSVIALIKRLPTIKKYFNITITTH